MKRFNLTELQSQHIEAVRWLLSDTRCQGKSYLMAILFIEKAINNMGRYIKVYDHYPNRSFDNMLEMISHIYDRVKQDNDPVLTVNFTNKSIKFDRSAND